MTTAVITIIAPIAIIKSVDRTVAMIMIRVSLFMVGELEIFLVPGTTSVN